MPTVDLRTRLSQALADRHVSANEAEGLLHTARRDGISPDEAALLRDGLLNNRDAFVDSVARQSVERALSGSTERRDLADPAVLDKHQGSVAHTWVDGQLFVDGVSSRDVVQGSIANCYLVAALSAVAEQSPEVIEDAIRDNGDGTFTVRFYEPTYGGRFPPNEVFVTVDGQLPTTGGTSLQYAKGQDRSELWVPLIEKAYAQWKGSYETIGNGGSPGAVMGALVGRQDSYTGLYDGIDGERLYGQLERAFEGGQSVVAATHGKDREELYNGSGLYAWHAYTVLGVEEVDGEKYVQLRNPWGRSEPGNDGVNDGVFRLTVDEFAKYYAGVWMN